MFMVTLLLLLFHAALLIESAFFCSKARTDFMPSSSAAVLTIFEGEVFLSRAFDGVL
ncbi:hypothetical protein KC19_9G092100 [Ceratodon purpureus]|uniref:Uncharacterized protein n=1 Tax=Ceratodon purpureus TaxID=3225 RepID=A0A8T0GQB3_CERPU|nr:hypothetical protein KC19_9G092100 [Ceratodon purpureus]